MSIANPEKLFNEAVCVTCTPAAITLIERLVAANGPLLFHHQGGCSYGSVPVCYRRDEFKPGAQDICVGKLGEQPFYMAASQFEEWRNARLVVDATAGSGSAFSLETPEGMRFSTSLRSLSHADGDACTDAGADVRLCPASPG